MTILYFTSTGNCLYVAKKIGGNLCSIPQAVKAGKYNFEDDCIGVVFPVFGLCVPPYVEEFLSKVQFKSNYQFAIITYGFFDGAATSHFMKLTSSYGIKFNYVTTLKMVENYLPGFEMDKQIQKEPKKEIEKHIEQIISDIKNKKQFIHQDSFIDKFLTKNHLKNYGYKPGLGETKNYHLCSTCHGCGTCVKVCPVDNIKIGNGKPVFGPNCISCLACTQNCPNNAIKMTSEKSTARFRNKHIKLEEIIASNK